MEVLYLTYAIKNDKPGAEQQDLMAGIRLLRELPDLSVKWLSLDLTNGEIFDNDNSNKLPLSKLKFSSILHFVKYKTIAFDRAMRKPFRLYTLNNLDNYITLNKIDLIITTTNSTVLYGLASGKFHIFRSQNYEPLHSLGEVESRTKARIHSFLKYLSVWLELKANIIWAVSPRDMHLYKSHVRASKKSTVLTVPSMQFVISDIRNTDNLQKRQIDLLKVGFLGSTYSVLHNRRGLENIIKAFTLINSQTDMGSFLLNVYGQKAEQFLHDIPENVRLNGWVNDIDQIYEENDVFVVPYVGGAGMQSKVFEPLYRGKLLICDPRTLAGYDFTDKKHFLTAKNSQEIIFQLQWAKQNNKECQSISFAARKKALDLFGREHVTKLITSSIKAFRQLS